MKLFLTQFHFKQLNKERIMKTIKSIIQEAVSVESNMEHTGIINTNLNIEVAHDEYSTYSGSNILKLKTTHDLSIFISCEHFMASFVAKLTFDEIGNESLLDFSSISTDSLMHVLQKDSEYEDSFPPEFRFSSNSPYKEMMQKEKDADNIIQVFINALNEILLDEDTPSKATLMKIIRKEHKEALQVAIKAQQDLLALSMIGSK